MCTNLLYFETEQRNVLSPPCSLNRNKVLVDCWLAVSSGAVTLRYCPQLQLIFLLYKAQPRPHRPTILSGIFFVLPCIESYQKVDLRTITLGVPPQEVSVSHSLNCQCYWCWMSPQGADQGQRDGVCGRRGLLQGQQRHGECGQRGERPPQHQAAVPDHPEEHPGHQEPARDPQWQGGNLRSNAGDGCQNGEKCWHSHDDRQLWTRLQSRGG